MSADLPVARTAVIYRHRRRDRRLRAYCCPSGIGLPSGSLLTDGTLVRCRVCRRWWAHSARIPSNPGWRRVRPWNLFAVGMLILGRRAPIVWVPRR